MKLSSSVYRLGEFADPLSRIAFIALTMLAVYATTQHFYSKHNELKEQSQLDRVSAIGEMAARVLTEVKANDAQTERMLTSLMRIEGVQRMTLVNQFGGVVVPRARAFEIVNDPTLEGVLESGAKPAFNIQNSSAKGTLYQPLVTPKPVADSEDAKTGEEQDQVQEVDSIYGALIVEFSYDELADSEPNTGYWMLCLVLGIAAYLLAGGLASLARLPWLRLASEAEQCVSHGGFVDADSHATTSLLRRYGDLVNRLLVKANRDQESVVEAQDFGSNVKTLPGVQVVGKRKG